MPRTRDILSESRRERHRGHEDARLSASDRKRIHPSPVWSRRRAWQRRDVSAGLSFLMTGRLLSLGLPVRCLSTWAKVPWGTEFLPWGTMSLFWGGRGGTGRFSMRPVLPEPVLPGHRRKRRGLSAALCRRGNGSAFPHTDPECPCAFRMHRIALEWTSIIPQQVCPANMVIPATRRGSGADQSAPARRGRRFPRMMHDGKQSYCNRRQENSLRVHLLSPGG